jgi:hypothetical protein
MILRFVPLVFIAGALAQESQPALTPAEKEFQESMSGVTLNGHYTRQDGSSLSDDKYAIESVIKVKGDLWRFVTRVQYSGHDLKIPVELQVKWAGDTPVITLTNMAVGGMGSFTVRIIVYKGQYAGTWSNAKGHGGTLFGNIIKTAQ